MFMINVCQGIAITISSYGLRNVPGLHTVKYISWEKIFSPSEITVDVNVPLGYMEYSHLTLISDKWQLIAWLSSVAPARIEIHSFVIGIFN